MIDATHLVSPSTAINLSINSNESKFQSNSSVPLKEQLPHLVDDYLGKTFFKKGAATQLSNTVSKDPSLPLDLSTALSFDKLVEEITLKIWTLLRGNIKLQHLYSEEQEREYKTAIKAQVRSYLSWAVTALHVASIATGLCSISFTLMPGASTELCKRSAQFLGFFKFEWYHNLVANGRLDPTKFAESVTKALSTGQQVIGSGTRIKENYLYADRTAAQSTAEISKIRLERTSKATDEERNQRDSVLQTLQQAYQQELEAKKSLSR